MFLLYCKFTNFSLDIRLIFYFFHGPLCVKNGTYQVVTWYVPLIVILFFLILSINNIYIYSL